MRHTKYLFRSEGCEPIEYDTAFLGQIRTGVRKSFPCDGDKRAALILPRYIDQINTEVSSKKQRKLRFATILGFIGMLRPHTFQQIGVKTFIIVSKDESCSSLTPFSSGAVHWRRNNNGNQAVLGFYITFTSKIQRHAKAYFPNISVLKGNLAKICPVAALFDLLASRMVRDGFLSNLGRGSPLCNYLQKVTGNKASISPYSLRIGGRTLYITMGLDRQFVDFLGT